MAISKLKQSGGTDFSKTTGVLKASVGTHQSNMLVNVTGSGYLTGLITDGTAQGFSVQIDNGDIYSFSTTGASMFMRFKTSLKVYCANANRNVSYILD